MSTGHTAGPWVWVGDSDLHGGNPPDSVIFCTAEYDDCYYGELHITPEDRALIAASPDFLAACTQVRFDALDALLAVYVDDADDERLQEAHDLLNDLRAAVAKATGEDRP